MRIKRPIAQLATVAILLAYLAGCANTDTGDGQTDTSLLPAVVICFFASCETQFNDRTTEQAVEGDLEANEGDATAEQEGSTDANPAGLF